MPISKNLILKHLHKANLCCRIRKTAEEIEVLSGIYFQDFGHYDPVDFVECLRRHRLISPWFPTPSDISDIYKVVKNDSRGTPKAIPAPTEISVEQQRINMAGIERFRSKLGIFKAVQRARRRDPERAAMIRQQAQNILTRGGQ